MHEVHPLGLVPNGIIVNALAYQVRLAIFMGLFSLLYTPLQSCCEKIFNLLKLETDAEMIEKVLKY